MQRSRWIPVAMAIAAAGAMVRPVAAQDAGGPPAAAPGGGAGGPGGGWGGPGGQMPNWEEMRKRMDQRTMTQLGVTDEEWAVLKPKIDKVRALRMQGMGGFGGFGGGGMGFGGPGGPGGAGGGDRAASPVAQATRDLQEALSKKDAGDDVIKAKLAALHDARAKAQQELKTAQDELKELVTVRQEAVLNTMGVLD